MHNRKPDLLVQLSEDKNALSVFGKYGGGGRENKTTNKRLVAKNKRKAEVFNENDVMKRMGLTEVKDNAELVGLLKPEHRHFFESLVLNEP